jgi:pilus assembly protein Flp/PilA
MPLIGGALIRRPSMFLRSQKGQGLAEYALILALIAILAIAALAVMSGAINGALSKVGNSI